MSKLHHEIENKLRLDGTGSGSNSRFARREKSIAQSINATSASEKGGTSGKAKKKTSRSRSGSKSPGRGGLGTDRYLPSVNKQPLSAQDYLNINTEDIYQQSVMNAIGTSEKSNILSYGNRPKTVFGGNHASKVIFSASKSKTKIKANRSIPTEPDRVLDAPSVKDDFYLNLMDWGPNNVLAVALGNVIFLWNAETAEIAELAELKEPNEYISSVKWIDSANLAFGDSRNRVQIWDIESKTNLRKIRGHAARVSSLAPGKEPNPWLLSAGSLSGQVQNYDVRQRDPTLSTFSGHELEVSGLAWSGDGKYLASSGNDNIINIWSNDVANGQPTPVHQLTDHQAGVKAVSWCPWKNQVLASGGGSACRKLMIWNCATGAKLAETDTENQVSGIHWNQNYRELITGHGYPNNVLKLWKYPKFSHITDLEGHDERILSTTMSPCSQMVASLAGDETLRIWKCFENQKATKAKTTIQNPSKIITTLR